MRYKPEKIKPNQTWQAKIGQKKRQEPNVMSPLFLTSSINVTQLNGLTQLLMLAAIGSLVGSSLAALPDSSCQPSQADPTKSSSNVNANLSHPNSNQTSIVLEEMGFSSQRTDNFQPPLLQENDTNRKSASKQKTQPTAKNGKATFFKPMTEKLLVKCLPSLQGSIQTLSTQNFLNAKKCKTGSMKELIK